MRADRKVILSVSIHNRKNGQPGEHRAVMGIGEPQRG